MRGIIDGMTRAFVPPIALFAAATAWLPLMAQTGSATAADDAAEAAQLVAARATEAFERIDPDMEMPPQIGTTSPEASAPDDAALIYAGLPPILADDMVTFAGTEPEALSQPASETAPEAPRGPAVRMISSEVAQPLPVAAPAPTPAAISSNDPFVIKSILPIEGSIRYGDWFWDDDAAPATGKLVITVDLDARVISAFRDGHEIGTAVALLGTQRHPTPLGTFPILTKEKDNISEKYNNAPMPHTLRLTWDGIAIHGSPVLNGYASHGCIGVPDEFAAKLFAAAKRGDKVIITRGKMIGIGDKVM